jgi:glucan endo-1,3-beta-D-glucosidase
MWASSGQVTIDNEIAALRSAISTYGTAFTKLVTGLSVGSEDLYRLTPTSLANDPGSVGASPDTIVKYINQVRTALAGTALSAVPIGHVDTWTGWVNGSNSAVAKACDWVGMNTFPYFQSDEANSIEHGADLFNAALAATTGASAGKPVWITETGWPVGGKQFGGAVASTKNAKAYYDAVGCKLFGNTNVFWYTLVDANTDPSQPQFGVVGTSLSSTPLFDLTCPAASSSTSASATKTGSSTSGAASAAKTGGASVTSVTSAGSTATGTAVKSVSGTTLVASVSSAAGGSTAATTAAGGVPAGTSTTAATTRATGAATKVAGSLGAIGALMAVIAAL